MILSLRRRVDCLCLTAVVVGAVGCATTATEPRQIATRACPSAEITPVSFDEVAQPQSTRPALAQPHSVADDQGDSTQETVIPQTVIPQTITPQSLPPVETPLSGLTLATLEDLARGSNPAISKANARISALRGKCVQVGLPPNPTAGYVGSEMGNDGSAGQQGAFLGQQFIRGQKLQRNRAVVAAEIMRAREELAVAERRVRTDVQQSFYAALLAQRRVELAEQLVFLTSEAANASLALFKAEEIPRAGLLQTEIQQQNARVMLQTAENRYSQAWRTLSAVVGVVDLPVQPLIGDVRELPAPIDWQEQVAWIQRCSPEVAAALAEVERARRALGRACVEATPDVSTQVSVQYDDASQSTIAGVQVGMPLPIWNRNQGGICQAQAEVTEAVRNVDRVELDLARRLAAAYREYADARVTVETYAEEILPRAENTFELVQEGYEQGEVGYLDALSAQQTFSQANLTYLDALGRLWENYLRIDGLLLEGSLAN